MPVKKVFGPVPSRRLGRSIGINNIPPKICSYSCVYCQIGFSLRMSAELESFYQPEEIAAEVEQKLAEISAEDAPVDYLTIVPDGEPSLDANLGRLFELLSKKGIKTAIITNSTMLHLPEVRDALYKADWVSVKVDAVDEKEWRRIDKPHKSINFTAMLDGIRKFAEEYQGTLVTETMLVRGLNDNPGILKENAAFMSGLNPKLCYLSIPTRPPADKKVSAPDEAAVNRAYQIYRSAGLPAEYLIGYEGNEFSATGNAADDILSITSVHPMREDAVLELLKKTGSDFSIIDILLEENKLKLIKYNNESFYLRKFR